MSWQALPAGLRSSSGKRHRAWPKPSTNRGWYFDCAPAAKPDAAAYGFVCHVSGPARFSKAL